MASSSSIIHFFLFSLLCFSPSYLHSASASSPFIIPVQKDPQSSLFYTSLAIGTPLHPMNLIIDLEGPSLWYDCDSQYNSSSYTPLPCSPKHCPASFPCNGCNAPFKLGCSNHTCAFNILNSLARFIFFADLGHDLISISPTQQLAGILSGCTTTNDLLKGLPKQSKGIMGLARTQLSFPTQLSLAYNLPPNFALCLPSSPNSKGSIFIGNTNTPPKSLSGFLFSTPLVINPVRTAPIYPLKDASFEYFITVKSISVVGNTIKFDPSLLSIDENGNGGTTFSTVAPYTRLHSSIFKPLVREFVKRASERKMKKVGSVGPLEACFDARTIGKSVDVPVIEMEVEGNVVWSIYEGNSMVEVKKNVVCLGFVDGGKVGKGYRGVASIEIGGHALEDNYLEFDLGSDKLYFSNWLSRRNTSCSHSSVSSF